MSGGISITRLNGPGTPEQRRVVYWNDEDLNQTQGNNNGIWGPLCGSRPDPISAISGVDSGATPGIGVHRWGATTSCSRGTWGDMRDIQTWAHVPVSPATELEITAFGEPEPDPDPDPEPEPEPRINVPNTGHHEIDTSIAAPLAALATGGLVLITALLIAKRR